MFPAIVARSSASGLVPAHDFARHDGQQATTIATQLAMVACGLGVAIAPSLTAAIHDNLAIRPLRDPAPLIALSLLVGDHPDPLVDHFVATVATALDQTTRP